MLQLYAITIALLAFTTSVLTVGFGLYTTTRRDIQHMIDVVGGLASAFLWFVAAFGAAGLEVVTDGGSIVTAPSESVAYLFAVFGVFMLIVALLGTAVLMNVTDVAEMSAGSDR